MTSCHNKMFGNNKSLHACEIIRKIEPRVNTIKRNHIAISSFIFKVIISKVVVNEMKGIKNIKKKV